MAIRLYSTGSILTTGALADIYTCTATRGAYVRSIQVCNTHNTGSQVVHFTLNRSPTDWSLVKNLTLPLGSTVSVMSDPFVMMTSDKIKGYILTGSANSVNVIVSVEEFT